MVSKDAHGEFLDGRSSLSGSCPDPLLHSQLIEILTAAVSRETGIPVNQIGLDISLVELGMTSQQLLAVRSRFEEIAQRDLSATICWQYPSIGAMADYLLRPEGDDCTRVMAVGEPSAAVEVLSSDEVLRMSDSEFEAYLDSLAGARHHGE